MDKLNPDNSPLKDLRALLSELDSVCFTGQNGVDLRASLSRGQLIKDIIGKPCVVPILHLPCLCRARLDDPPHAIPPLPCDLTDQAVFFHPRQIALNGRATGSSLGVALPFNLRRDAFGGNFCP